MIHVAHCIFYNLDFVIPGTNDNTSNHSNTLSVTFCLASTMIQCPTPSKAMSCSLGMNVLEVLISAGVDVASFVPQKWSTGRSARSAGFRFAAARTAGVRGQWVLMNVGSAANQSPCSSSNRIFVVR